MKRFRYLLTHYPLSLVCLALIWFLCLFIDVGRTPISDVPFIDKWTHFLMYGGTCSVIWWEYLRCHRQLVGWKLFLLAWLCPILMSGCIELLQEHCTRTRSGEWLDFAANATGVTLGALIGLMIWRWRK